VRDRWAAIRNALGQLAAMPGLTVVVPSPVFETEPVGVLEQPRFLNLVVGVESSLTPEQLLRRLLEIEAGLGRQRTVRWGPRTLDLDLLLFEGETRHGAELELPHPRMWERAFVLAPLRELLRDPRFAGPVWNDLRNRLAGLSLDEGVRRWSPP